MSEGKEMQGNCDTHLADSSIGKTEEHKRDKWTLFDLMQEFPDWYTVRVSGDPAIYLEWGDDNKAVATFKLTTCLFYSVLITGKDWHPDIALNGKVADLRDAIPDEVVVAVREIHRRMIKPDSDWSNL